MAILTIRAMIRLPYSPFRNPLHLAVLFVVVVAYPTVHIYLTIKVFLSALLACAGIRSNSMVEAYT